jgi:plastocyanin domain-containing protein
MKKIPFLLAAVFAGALPLSAAPKIPANAQKITVTLPQGYTASPRTVRAGKPVALTFLLASNAGCGNEVMVPAAKWKKTLKVGQRATVIYTPKKSGPLVFACGMNHMKGSIVVK